MIQKWYFFILVFSLQAYSGTPQKRQFSAEYKTLKKARSRQKKQWQSALKLYHQLATSSFSAIKVRALYERAMLLQSRSEYFLALQVYNEIIVDYQHSGFWPLAIEKGLKCAHEIGDEGKIHRYGDLYQLFFPTRVTANSP